MADDKLRIVASVEDQFTGPLAKLQKGLKSVGDETSKHGASWKKDWAGVREEAEKYRGVLGGFQPILSGIGLGGFAAAASLGGVAAALKGFTSSTRDLSLMGKQIGMTVDQLRTFGALGGTVGVSADTMRGAIGHLADQARDLRNHWGQTFVQLQSMNLGKLAESLASAPNMQAMVERAMEGIQKIPDPMIAARVSTMVFGTPDIATVVRNLGGTVKDALKDVHRQIGSIDKETEEASKRFEGSIARMGNAFEKLKTKTLGPLASGAATLMEGAADAVETDPNDPKSRLRYLNRRKAELDEQIKALPEGSWKRQYNENNRAGVDDEIKKLEEAIARGAEKGVDKALGKRELEKREQGEATVQQQSFSGSGAISGNGSLIQKAAWGGFGGPLGGSAGSGPLGNGPGGAGVYGGSGVSAGPSPSAPLPHGQQIDRAMPDLGDGIRGRPFGSKGPLGGKKGPVGIPYDATDLKGALGINDAQWSAYREGLTDIEGKRYEQVGGASGRFSGRYQFGPSEIAQTARQLGEAPPTRAQFLGDKAMQERFMERYTLEHHKFLERNSAAYRDMPPEKKLEILGYAHNQGAGRGRGRTVGALGYLESGRVGHDGFGTAGTRYFDTIRKRLAEIQGIGTGTGTVASAGPLSDPSGPLSAPKPDAPDTDGAPEQTDGRGVNADLIKVLKRAQQLSKVKFHIHEGLRTLERQREMVRRGWSKTMDSEHLKGRAVDVRADGDPAVGALDRKKYEEINRAMRQASEEAGIPVEWGGDWKKFKDVPHFQFPKGYRAGPNAYAGDAPAGKPRADDVPGPRIPGGGSDRNGTLRIKFENAPPGMRTSHDMSDLFRNTEVSHGRSQMDMKRA